MQITVPQTPHEAPGVAVSVVQPPQRFKLGEEQVKKVPSHSPTPFWPQAVQAWPTV
jgi:hypothetical protein